MTFPLPGDLTVEPPAVPGITIEPPGPDVGVFVPVEGPRGPVGPVGPEGPQGVPGDAGTQLSYIYTTSNPAMVHQINHGLNFNPAGITCIDGDGASLLAFSVSYPSIGIAEITFGSAVAPTIYLS